MAASEVQGARVEPGRYEIRIKGQIAEEWRTWFDEFAISYTASGETLLHGLIQDQSALHGLLAKFRALNLILISINRVEKEEE